MGSLRAAVAGLLAAGAVSMASAQSGGLKVHVYDARDDQGMPGAVVALSHATGNVAPFTVATDAAGYALFPVLRAGGGYIVEISFPGYAKVILRDQRVKISETIVLPIGLAEAITEEVEVVATRETVDLASNAQSTKFSDEFIQDLPVQGRFYQNVLTLAAGVSDDDGDGNPNVNGARDRDFKTLVGGVANVDPFSGRFLNFVNPDSIEEIEIITAGAGPEFGRAQGGFANIVQKQGSNEFEGLFGTLYSSSKLDGSGADQTIPASLFPEFQSYQPSISVSGPILADRLWYFFSYEYHHIETPTRVVGDSVIAGTTQPIGSGTVTWQASPRNKISFKYDLDPITTTNLGGGTGLRTANNLYRQEIGGPSYQMRWSAAHSPNLLVDGTVAYQDTHSNLVPMTDAAGADGMLGTSDDNRVHYASCVSSNDLPILAGSDCRSTFNGVRSGSFFLMHRDQRQRLTVRADAEMFRGKLWGMSHQLKVGFIVENERYFELENRQPVSRFDRLPGVFPGGQRLGILTSTFSLPAVWTGSATGTTWGVYVRDEIEPASNVSITAGIRFEREATNSLGVLPIDPAAEQARFERNTAGPPYGRALDPATELKNTFTAYEDVDGFVDHLAESLGVNRDLLDTYLRGVASQSLHWRHRRRPGDVNLVNDNVSPFLSVSWDPWNNAKTKFGLSAGRHYNNLPLQIPTLELQPPNAAIQFKAVLAPPSGYVISTLVDALSRDGVNPALNVFMVDRGLRTPYQDELSFVFERELSAETLFRLSYVRRKFEDQLQDIDINHLPGDRGRCLVQFSHEQICESNPDGSIECGWIHANPRTAENPTGGDGVLDDCVGATEVDVHDLESVVNRPDGVPDAYVQNPAFGQINLVGNFNSARYDGVTLQLDRRLYRGWQMNASYTWSRSEGAAEDFLQELGDDASLVRDEFGLLSYDLTHVVKVNATTITPWGFRLGGTISWQSGYPYSLLAIRSSGDAVTPALFNFGVPDDPRPRTTYPTHRRNDQRNEPYWLFNVRVARELNLKGGKNLQLTAEIFNLLNQAHTRYLDTTRISSNQISTTLDDGQAVHFGRQYQVGFKLAF